MKRAQKTELTVSRILQSALAEFGARGYAGGTINHICQSGISKGLIYHNFQNKDDLYLACLKISCSTLLSMLKEGRCGSDLTRYMQIRMDFFRNRPQEARIFFEAILQPPESLLGQIQEILRPLEEVNERVFEELLSSVTLRDGVTREDALLCLHQMQRMFNAYFSSPAYHHMALDAQIQEHETGIPKLLNCMLYGIAKGGSEL